jgi:carboxyl-terminal processing protease
VVLDLRYNPGGLLNVALDTVGTFLEEGEVLSTSGRREMREQYPVPEDALEFPELPIVVLVNDGSASASEILAGALQDHNRAIVLGERTFGKGSVQRVLPLGKEARLKLTTALYYLPSGRSPHKNPGADKWGVDPDCDVKLTPKEIMKIIEAERKVYIIHNGDKEGDESMDKVDEGTVASLKIAEDPEDGDASDDPPLLSEEDIAALEADPYEARDVDPQLETALLLLRTKLAGKLPWPRQLAARPVPEDAPKP